MALRATPQCMVLVSCTETRAIFQLEKVVDNKIWRYGVLQLGLGKQKMNIVKLQFKAFHKA